MTAGLEAPARQDTCRAVRPLTLRERQVVSLAALGHTNRAIAARLALTEEGVKSSMRKVFDKLGVTSRTAAATVAGSLGSLLPSEHLPAQPLIRVGIAPLSRVTKADLRDVVARWQDRAPGALLDELRGLLGEATTGRPRRNLHATRALRLAAQGWPTDKIAAEIGSSRRSVQRYLQEAT